MDEIIDILISIPILVLAIVLTIKKFKAHPSDKYHNESWKTRKRDQ